MTDKQAYCCTKARCKQIRLKYTKGGLSCPNGHLYPFAPGTNVPVFTRKPADANEYTRENASTLHDNALRWVFATFNTDEASLRESLVSRLQLTKGDRVLVTGAGAGNDLPFLAQGLEGSGKIFVQDIALPMLLSGLERYQKEYEQSNVELNFSASDAANLPFPDDYFDAAYHFGGINLFPEIRSGIDEMNRVVKSGGKVVIGDEGIAPWLKETDHAKMLIKNNSLYDCSVPVSLLPESATEVKISWELGNCFYVIEFVVSNQPLQINIDVPHVGKRGGSIRTRYFGKLEGVEPDLRDRIYDKAERLGLSRVEYIESLLRAGLSDD